MMSLSMNFTVIPFLLGAFVSVKNQTEWNLGPEYVFKLNKTTVVYMPVLMIESVTAMVKCHPKKSSQRLENVLFCHARKIIHSELSKRNDHNDQMYEHKRTNKIDAARSFTPHEKSNSIPDKFFKMVFSTQGVQSYQVTGREKEPSHCDIIFPNVIEQFDIGIDLNIKAESSIMKTYENKTNGIYSIYTSAQSVETTKRAFKCNSSIAIEYTLLNEYHNHNQYHEHENFRNQKHEENSNFHLILLPISYMNSAGKTFSIRRSRTACTIQPQNIVFLNRNWQIDDMEQYYNEMVIHDTKPKFTSRTHLEGTAFFPTNSITYKFTEDVHLALLRIKPAQSKHSQEKQEDK